MSKKLIIILTTLLTTLVLSSTLGGAYLVYAQEVDENQVDAENLLSMLTSSEAEVISLFETIVGDGGEVPEDAEEALVEAQLLHAEAQGLYDEGSFEECVDKATESLNMYGEALTKAIPEEPETITQEQEETMSLVELYSAIEQAWSRISTLEQIAAELKEQEIDVSMAEEHITQAKDILGEIPEDILPEETEEVESKLVDANSILDEATELLRVSGESIKQDKMAHFIQQAQHHAAKLETKMERVMRKHGLDTDGLVLEYSALMLGFEEVGSDVSKNGLKNSISELKALVKHMDRIGKGHVDEEAGFTVEVIESITKEVKMEGRIERYRNQIIEMKENVVLTEDEQILVEGAEGLLDDAMEALAAGDKELADELFEEAKETLETMGDLLGGFGKGNGKGPKPGKGYNKEGKPLNSKAPKKEKKPKTNGDPENP